MKSKSNTSQGQACCLILLLFCCASCDEKKGESPVIPPLTFPLSQPSVGFGVVNVSYTRVTTEPQDDSASPGYLRRGSVVQIYERRLIKQEGQTETWVLVEGACKGWLKEILVDVYDNESQAQTASGAIGR